MARGREARPRSPTRDAAVAACVERAFDADGGRALRASPPLAEALERDAKGALAALGPETTDARAVSVARRRLLRARLLLPRGSWREAGERLLDLGHSTSAEVRRAARPWTWEGSAEHPYVAESALRERLETEIPEERRAAIDCWKSETWPAGWRELLGSYERSPNRNEVFLEWTLWRPELSFLWHRLGNGLREAKRYPEAFRCYEIGDSLEASPENLFWGGVTLRQLGEPARAVEWLERAVRLDRERGLDPLWHQIDLAMAHADQGTPEQDRLALAVLVGLERQLSQDAWYWFERAAIAARLGDASAPEARRKARELGAR